MNIRLYFRKAELIPIIAHCRSATDHIEFYGEKIDASLILTADGGIYIWSSGVPSLLEDGTIGQASKKLPMSVAYALGCDPRSDSFDHWHSIHKQLYGGSDDAERISVDRIGDAVKGSDDLILIWFYEDSIIFLGDRSEDFIGPDK